MQTYIQQIIGEINSLTKVKGPVLFFGENIDNGSKIAGLARGLESNSGVTIKNVGNCELTHCGVGMGMLADRGSSVLFVKQLDFMLLALDQIVNTFNYIRAHKPSEGWGSFTIFTIVCDQGYQGSQSSFSGAIEIGSLANSPVFCINTAAEASSVIKHHFITPGFRLICLSQKYLNSLAFDIKPIAISEDQGVFKYKDGSDLTIVSCTFALRVALEVYEKISKNNVSSSLFHINFLPKMDWDAVISSCTQTGKLLIIDDCRSILRLSDLLLRELAKRGIATKVHFVTKGVGSPNTYGANSDEIIIDMDAINLFAAS
ncbi:hypothetical protein G6646_00085 [Polynucleobacter paneuropaeus]|nr:hypothetical protein [Polynucleobacter paneuropaeus]